MLFTFLLWIIIPVSIIVSVSIIIPLLMAVLNGEIKRLAVRSCAVKPGGCNRTGTWFLRVECLVVLGAKPWRETIGGPVAEVHVCIFSEEAADSRANVQGAAIAW